MDEKNTATRKSLQRWLSGIVIVLVLAAISPFIWMVAIYFWAYVINGVTG